MSQNKDDKSVPPRPAPDAGLPKRPVPTIDLKATEVKTDAKPSAGTASAPASMNPSVKPADVKAAAATVSASKPATGSVPGISNVDAKSATAAMASDKKPDPSKPQPTSAGPANAKTTTPPTAAPKSSSSIGRALSYMSAAVLGGLIAIFGADLLASTVGIDVRPASTAVEDLTARVAKVEKSGAQAPSGLQSLTEQLTQANTRIEKLEAANRQLTALSAAQTQLATATRALEEKVGQGGAATASPEATGRITKLEETIQGLSALAQAQPGRPLPEMARLSTKINEMEVALAAVRKSAGGDAVAQVDARLAEARKAEAQLTESMTQLKAESAKRLREVEAVKTQAERLEQKVDGIKSDTGTARSTVDALKSDMTAQLQSVARQGDLKATADVVDKRVAGLETKIESLSKRDEERQANAERIVVSLQLANLKRVMDQGKPFGDALADVEKTAGSLVDIAPLKAFREKGVPNASDLATQFKHVARTVLEAEQDRAQTSTVDRLLQSAKSVVQIRRVGGDVEGNSTEAILARAEFALKSGDLLTAAKEMKTLKPELRIAAQGWLDQLDARVAVDRALGAIEDKLKTSIAATPVAGKGGK